MPKVQRWIFVAMAAVAIGAMGYVMLSSSDDVTESAVGEVVQFETVEASETDLVEYTDLAGTMQFANIEPVPAATVGTVTAMADDGETLNRGDVVYAVDAEPIVLFYGAAPLYRTMSNGDEGEDVRLVEENLASLGFHTYQDDDEHADTGFVVDGVFDDATEDAVLRFQERYGFDETGTVDADALFVASGASTVASVSAEPGDSTQPGSPILDLYATTSVDGFFAAHSGDLVLETTSGPIGNGTVVYTVDDVPVSAVTVAVGSDFALTRNLYLGVSDGPDVAAVEQMLADLGYNADGEMVVDDEFTSDTSEAINDWEGDLEDHWDDVVNDGAVSVSEIILIEEATQLGTPLSVDRDLTVSGTELATETTSLPTRVVITTIPVADQAMMVEGQDVDVEFPDNTVVVGTVTNVANTSSVEAGDPEAEPTLAVEVSLPQVPESAEGLAELDVTIKLVDRVAIGAIVVPASALVATADGGFAVEVVTAGGATQFVAVDPGQFTDGLVEVVGIDPGTTVVVPR